jgi:hypothetical protein
MTHFPIERKTTMHLERHSIGKVGWLRAAVLGANDGIVSTASLVLGVAAAGTSPSGILLAGVAGLVAGAMSMATGEYVSVSSQADSEHAALSQEKESWRQIMRKRCRNWLRCTGSADWSRLWHTGSRNSLWRRMRWTLMPGKSWG